MFTLILSSLAALVVANLFTTFPILAAYYSGDKRDNKDRIFTILAILAIFLLLGAMCLFLAMPDILDWISGYIGEFMTWVIFLGGIGAFIAWCVDKGNN